MEKLAIAVSEHTLVGAAGDFPLERGNCFSVTCSDGSWYKIVNFVYENLKEGLRREKLSWPVKIKTISERHAVIHDERIPCNWYSARFCEVCCPRSLLPVPQLLAHERQIARGQRKETPATGGRIGSVCIDTSKIVEW